MSWATFRHSSSREPFWGYSWTSRRRAWKSIQPLLFAVCPVRICCSRGTFARPTCETHWCDHPMICILRGWTSWCLFDVRFRCSSALYFVAEKVIPSYQLWIACDSLRPSLLLAPCQLFKAGRCTLLFPSKPFPPPVSWACFSYSTLGTCKSLPLICFSFFLFWRSWESESLAQLLRSSLRSEYLDFPNPIFLEDHLSSFIFLFLFEHNPIFRYPYRCLRWLLAQLLPYWLIH